MDAAEIDGTLRRAILARMEAEARGYTDLAGYYSWQDRGLHSIVMADPDALARIHRHDDLWRQTHPQTPKGFSDEFGSCLGALDRREIVGPAWTEIDGEKVRRLFLPDSQTIVDYVDFRDGKRSQLVMILDVRAAPPGYVPPRLSGLVFDRRSECRAGGAL